MHHKVDKTPEEVRPVGPRPHHGQRIRDVAVPALTSLAFFGAQGGQVHACLSPHAGIKLLQRGVLSDEVLRPECLEDAVGDLPHLCCEGSQWTCPVLAAHGRCHLTREEQKGRLQGLQSPLPVHARPLQGSSWAPRAIPPGPGIADILRPLLHTCRG